MAVAILNCNTSEQGEVSFREENRYIYVHTFFICQISSTPVIFCELYFIVLNKSWKKCHCTNASSVMGVLSMDLM